MQGVRFINPDTLAKPPGYTYVVEAAGPSRTIYVAGQLGLDMENKLVGAPGDFRAQAVKAFENLESALAAVGAGFADVVKINNYLTDMSHLMIFREVRDMFINTSAPPASTLVAISQLARPGALFEIEAIAVLPAKAAREACGSAAARAVIEGQGQAAEALTRHDSDATGPTGRALLLALASPALAQVNQIEDIRVQLFYEFTGTLSEDLTKSESLNLFNTPHGGGSAKEPANAFLISVVVRGEPDSNSRKEPLVVTVIQDESKKRIVTRQFRNLYFGDAGVAIKPLLVDGQVCDPLRITARFKGATKSATIRFVCGE